MGWTHHDLTAITGAPIGEGIITGYAFDAGGTRHVNFVSAHVGPQQQVTVHLHELWWHVDGSWHHEDLTSVAGGQVANCGNGYVFRCSRHLDFLGQGVDQLRWRRNGGWHHKDLLKASGAPFAYTGGAHGYPFVARGTQHVNYPDSIGHVHHLWRNDAGWHHEDLTEATGAPLAGGNAKGYAFEARRTQHVSYVGQDEHVHHLWRGAEGWHSLDLTAATGAPDAEPNRDCNGFVFPSHGTQHVTFVGLDHHVHELVHDATGWHHHDLTAIAGGPQTQTAPFGYVFAGTRRVVYLGADNHVHQLTWGSGSWADADLTAAAGAAPTVDGDPMGFEFASHGSQHVVYLNDAGHVIELLGAP